MQDRRDVMFLLDTLSERALGRAAKETCARLSFAAGALSFDDSVHQLATKVRQCMHLRPSTHNGSFCSMSATSGL